MISVVSLWMPILVSAVIVFVASSIIHMVLGYHKYDMRKLAKEDEVMAALRPFAIPPADYGVPYAGSMEAMRSAEFGAKMKAGPVIYMTVIPSGPPSMGSSLIQWFVYCVAVSALAALVTGHIMGVGAGYRHVFHFVGIVAFASYAMALFPFSIWYRRSWATTLRGVFDGLIYALLTAGTFGWLWPR